MEEIKLPTVPELELIPIERRNFPEEDHKQEKIQHKRKERDSAARGLIAVTVASMMLNAVMAMIIYILQAGQSKEVNKEMDVKVKKDAEEEMNCILDLLEEWCLKYDQDYANAVVLVKHDQITSWGSIGNHEDFDVYRTKERP